MKKDLPLMPPINDFGLDTAEQIAAEVLPGPAVAARNNHVCRDWPFSVGQKPILVRHPGLVCP